MKAERTILSDYLDLLGVPYTLDYCANQFDGMPFKSLFGLSKLLSSYGVDSQGYNFVDKHELASVPVPFIATTDGGMVIVTSIDDKSVKYLSQGVEEQMDFTDWVKACDGTAFCAYPHPDACEPDYKAHMRQIFLAKARDRGIVICALLLFGYLFIFNRLYAHVSTVLLTMFDMAGIYLTYLLVQKSLRIHNSTADKVCKVLQEGGCDSILEKEASKLFGFFGWSEIGFTYFSVSLLALLIFPECISYLALFNACCLPYTMWSIWYQKFRAKAWCTLCVSVQCTLWCLFFCYLGGGWYEGIFPLRPECIVLGVVYLMVLLTLNRILPKFENTQQK